MAEVKFWVGTEKVDLVELTDKILVGIEKNGKLGHADVTTLMKMLAAASASGIEKTVQPADEEEPLAVLPAPEQSGKIMIMKGGTFLQPDGVTGLEVPANSFNIGYWDGSVWTLEISIETEADLSGYATKPELDTVKSKVDEVVVVSRNKTDYRQFKSGRWTNTGTVDSTNNWLRTPIIDITGFEGQPLVISGVQGMSTGNVRFVFFDGSGVFVSAVNGAGDNGIGYVSQSTVAPVGAIGVAVNIANVTNIGLTPTENIYSGTVQLELGADTPTEYVPHDVVDHTKLDYDVEGRDTQIEGGIDSFTVNSRNLIDMKSDVLSGRWNADGTVAASNNWIRTVYKNIPIELYGQPVTVSGGGAIPSGAMVIFKDESGSVLVSDAIISTGGQPHPYTFTLPADARQWAFTIANAAGIGLTPFDNTYTDRYQVESGEDATPAIPFGEKRVSADKITGLTDQFDESEVVVIRNSATTTNILYHGGGANDVWFRVVWFRTTNPTNFIDTWRLNDAYMVRRTGEFTYTNLKQIINEGVWENAIYTSGAGYTDALGSSHGWEQLTNVRFFIDGKTLDFSTAGNYRGRTFQAIQRSDFKTSDGSGNIANSMKVWEIKDGVLKIKNMIKWLGTLVILPNSFLSMLSIFRKNEQDEQITHTAAASEELVPYDVSEPDFTTPIFTNGNDPKRTSIIIWGNEVKAEMEVAKRKITLSDGSTLPDGLDDAGMFVQNTGLYNKLYGRFGSTSVENGDVWEVETVYKISFSYSIEN